MRGFQIICLPPLGLPDPSIAIAASRAGGTGVLDLTLCSDPEAAALSLAQLDRFGRGDCGVKLDAGRVDFLSFVTRALPPAGRTVILGIAEPEAPEGIVECGRLLRARGIRLLLEVTSLEEALLGGTVGAAGLIAKGNEAAGRVGEETTFILLQRILSQSNLPVWAQGGIGLHSAAACYAAGAAGVVLDAQLALTRESPLSAQARQAIGRMDGSETACVGGEIGEPYRIYVQPGLRPVEDLRSDLKALALDTRPSAEVLRAWRDAVRGRAGWEGPDRSLWLIGQDAAFAAALAGKLKTVGGVLQGMRQEIGAHVRAARRIRPLDHESPLARSHGTPYPIVQGPMTRVSDTAAFASEVAKGGGLPFLALALLRAREVDKLMEETRALLGDRPWGVGILGFVPLELRQEQLEEIRKHKPSYALIAGGRPDQARSLEQDGIPTYLHVPSPGLLKLFLENGSRRFVFEGRECGGHVGPRSSFVLWNTMIDILLEAVPASEASSCHVLFAAGIHDALSASMVATMAAPLAERGIKIGVLMGTAYLFTKEAVTSKAIVEGFQKEALDCKTTVLLETGPGHSTRCSETSFAEVFLKEKQRLFAEGRSAEEIREVLEELNLGRLRIASKGINRHPAHGKDPAAPKYQQLDDREQRAQGMYMIGQVAALRQQVCSIEELHREVSVNGSELLAQVPEPAMAACDQVIEQRPSDIAIIGLGCVLPKAPDVATYWSNIINKVDAITEVPRNRWDWRLYFDADRNARDKIYSKWGGFIDDVAFDPMRYGMPPNTIPSIEPLQLLTLEVVRAALQDSGYLDRPFPRARTSVVIGAGGGVADLGNQYGLRAGLPQYVGDVPEEILAKLPEWTEDSFAGILLNVAAGRVANRFDLGGSNYTVDAACASSLAAVYLAVKELESGTSDMVIVGGADTVQNPFGYLCFSKTKALSPRGRCSTFDESADGIVISEGLVALVLKRLADAERDGDRIYAVIKSVASSSDGRDKGLTAPRREGQIRALERAYAKANISPATVGLLEAHGTGTVAGDQAEVDALKTVFDAAAAPRQSIALGSVKSMIGHTKCTAGVASLTKVALSLYHKLLPPTLNVEKPNPKAGFSESPFYVNSELRPWLLPADGHPRRAGVSAFGFGGTNFHVVVEEYADEAPTPWRPAAVRRERPELMVWRGASRDDLAAQIADLAAALDRGARPDAADLSISLWGRAKKAPAGALTLAVVLAPGEDLRKKLAAAAAHLASPRSKVEDPTGIYFSAEPMGREGKIAFLFPGQGSQYPDMLKDLLIHFPEARAEFERFDQVLAERFPKPLSGYVFPPPGFSQQDQEARQAALTQTNVAQPALGAAGLAMFKILAALGVQPELMAGHSYGEYVALCAAGAFDERTLALLSEARGRCILEAAQQDAGTMAAVSEGRQRVTDLIGQMPDVWIANLNAPRQTVISGTRAGVEGAIAALKSAGISARVFPVACAFHSPLVAAARDKLATVLSEIPFASPRCSVFSNTTATPYPEDPKTVATLLTEHLVNPVLFADEIEAMYAAGARLFLEAGPRNVLTGLTQQTLGDRSYLAIATDVPGRNGLTQLLHTLGQLAANAVPINLDRLYEGRDLRELRLNALVEETQPKPLAPTTWLVNGGRARPLHEAPAPAQPAQPVQPTPPAGLPVVARAVSPRVVEPSPQVPAHVPAHAEPVATLPRSAPSPAPAATQATGAGGATQLMKQYQDLMQRFLETQKVVMLAALREPAAIPLPRPEQLDVRLVEPSQPPGRSIQPAPAPVALLATTQEPLAPPAPVTPEPIAAASVPTELDRDQIQQQLLQVVSERTGYPPEMLDPDVDMEADLGIDSIKRVEILGAVQRACLPADRKVDQHAMERLTANKTLRGIVDWFVAVLGASSEAEAPARSSGADQDSAPSAPQAPRTDAEPMVEVPRFKIVSVESAAPGVSVAIARHGVHVITDDEGGIARALADLIRAQGGNVALLRPLPGDPANEGPIHYADLGSPESVSEALDAIRRKHGPIEGVLHLLPLRSRATLEEMDLAAWRKRLRLEVKSLYLLARAAREDLKRSGAERRGYLIAATGMGGDFGLDGTSPSDVFPGSGGVTGLVKTLSMEWLQVRCKTVDVSSPQDAATLARQIFAELTADDGEPEVGYRNARRFVSRAALVPLEGIDHAPGIVSSESVVLVTGGARGITAEVACELARRYKPTLLLAGRSALPASEESPETSGLSSAQEIKAALMDGIRRAGESVTLSRVESAYNRLQRDREIRRNISLMRAAGATVKYYQVDVLDETALGACLDDVYRSYGRLNGLIHGAGIIEDKLLDDKTPDSFDRVFDTKVDSAFVLSRKLRPESLDFAVFFTSVAGPFGSRGQSDYCAANEVVNRLAVRLNRRWAGRVVAINWGPWRKGMAGAEVQKQFEERGVQIIPPATGRVLLDRELRCGPKEDPSIVLGAGPWRTAPAPAPLAAASPETSARMALPLLQRVTPSRGRGEGIEAITQFDTAEDLYLMDHRLDGKPVVPTAVAMELMAEFAQMGWPDLQVIGLRDLRVLKGMLVDIGPKTVRLAAHAQVEPPHDRVGVDVNVEITDPTNPGLRYYRATVELADRLSDPPEYELPFTETLRPYEVKLEDAYRTLLFHGPLFQGIERIHGIAQEGMVATLAPSSPRRCLKARPAGQWLIDPVVFDSGLQMVILWARMHLDMTPLPARFLRYRRFGSLSDDRVRCDLRITSRPNENLFMINIGFIGSDGRLVGLLEGMECPSSKALNRLAGGHLRSGRPAGAELTSPASPAGHAAPAET